MRVEVATPVPRIGLAERARRVDLPICALTALVLGLGFFRLGTSELEHPSWTNRVAYVVSSAAALDAHYFAAFVVLAQLLTLLALRRRAAFTKSWLGVAGAIVVLGLPETIHALNTGAGQISWIPSPSAGSLKQTMIDLGGGGRIAPTVLLAGCAFAVARAVSRRDRWREGFLVAWLAVPIVISFAASFVQPMFLSRYLIVSVPAFVLLAARGLTKLPAPVLVAGIAAAVCASGFQLATWYSARPREDWRAATRYVLTSTRPGDAVLFYPSYSQEPFAYYERLDGGARPRILDPAAPKPNGGPRVWLVIREKDTAQVGASLTTVERALVPYRRSSQRGFSGVQVSLYVRAA